MQKKLIIFLIILSSFCTANISFAKINVGKIYNNFTSRIEKNNDKNQEIIILNNIGKTFEKLLEKNKQNILFKNFLEEIIILNNKKISSLKNEKIPKIKENSNIDIQINHPEYIKILNKNGFEIIILDKNFEFKKDNKTYFVIFEKYYSPNSKNYKTLLNKDKKAKIFLKDNKYYFVFEYKIEEKINLKDAEKYFKKLITKQKRFFLKDGVYYFYYFTNYLSLKDNDNSFSISKLSKQFDLKETLLFFDNGKYYFVKDYKVVRLIPENIISDIKNKQKFLNIIIDDKKYFKNDNYDELFLNLKEYSKKLTKNLNENEKIKIIYSDIIKKLYYFVGDYNKNKKVFSGILSFKNKQSVCSGYIKLMAYMLMFSGIEDFEIKKGYVFNSVDFPNIGHAWIKIGDKYYDPTFDDPIGNKGDINQKDYLFFGLEKELFYTNRFEYSQKEKYYDKYKKLSLKNRNLIVEKNLFNLSDKYKNTNLIKKFIGLKKELGFFPGEKITIEKLKNKLKYFEVDKNYNFIENGKKRKIYKIEYFEITDDNIELLLKQLKEKFLKSYLLKFEQKNGTYKYYLTFKMEYK